tara:strand:- start:2882 stop:3067 length:186 start_codon:yes stop_codon:yes gene_type:complete
MARDKALEICKNLKRTLSKEVSKTCTEFANKMFNKPKIKVHILQKQMDNLIKKYDIKKKEL